MQQSRHYLWQYLSYTEQCERVIICWINTHRKTRIECNQYNPDEFWRKLLQVLMLLSRFYSTDLSDKYLTLITNRTNLYCLANFISAFALRSSHGYTKTASPSEMAYCCWWRLLCKFTPIRYNVVLFFGGIVCVSTDLWKVCVNRRHLQHNHKHYRFRYLLEAKNKKQPK